MRDLIRPFSARVWACAATAASPALRWHMSRRARIGKEIAARLPERFGIETAPRPGGPLVWIHAASVGESVSILPVLSALAPHASVLLTTGTVNSAKLLAERLPAAGLSERVVHRFAPLDVPAWVARFLDHWRPDAAAFVESELWPNQIEACATRGIPLMLVNGRMSAGSFAAWRRAPELIRTLLGHFAEIRARGDEDAERFHRLGAAHAVAAGDLKFAAEPLPFDEAALADMRAALGDRPLWLLASTHPGEETPLAAEHAALAARHPGLLTIVVPRHPERGADLARDLGAPRRGAGQGPESADIWIADTMGELGLWYRLAHAVFVGRSLHAPGGGQNPLEPARLGRAVSVGSHTGNFVEHVALLRDAGALRVVADAAEAARFADEMLSNRPLRDGMGRRAERAAERHGALPAETAAALLALARRGG